MLIVGEARGYYMKRPYTISSALDYSCVREYVNKSLSGDEFFKLLREDNYRFLLVSVPELLRLTKEYKVLKSSEVKKLFSFLRNKRPAFTVGKILIYSVDYNPDVNPSKNHRKILSDEKI